MKKLVCRALSLGAVCVSLSALGQVPTPVQPASPQLLENIYQQIEKRERGELTGGFPASAGLPDSMKEAMAANEFLPTRTQIRQLGAKAYPLTPRVAGLLLKSEKNKYDLAFILYDMTAQEESTPQSVSSAISKYRGQQGADKLALLASLGKIRSPEVVPDLQAAANDATPAVRLVAIIGMAFAGSTAPEKASATLSKALGDSEKVNRAAAANSIRILGPLAESTAPALLNYLKTRENVYIATGAMTRFSVAALLPAKPELESILGDSKLTQFQKQETVNMLVRLESEK
jgi:hypothetical protein